MRANVALIGNVRRIAVRVLVVALVVVTAGFIAIRLRQGYALETRVAEAERSHRDLMLKCAATQTEIAQRFDTIERVLFGDVLPKVDAATAAKPPALRLEALMLRNERELRSRVESLERRMLKRIED